MARILFLAHRIPYPPNKGDKIRSWNMLRHLATNHEVHLGAFVDDADDWAHQDYLRTLCADVLLVGLNPRLARLKSLTSLLRGEPLSLGYYRSDAMQRWVSRKFESGMDAVFMYSSPVAQFVLGRTPPGCRQVMDFVDIDSDKWAQYAAKHGFPMSWVYAREARTLAAYERQVATAVDASIFVSQAEAEMFRRMAPESAAKAHGVSNGVDHAFFSPDRPYDNPLSGGDNLVFTGAMDYWANVEAVVWFARSVLPLIQVERPEAHFWIVGGKPTAEVEALRELPGITVTGRVPDVRPYIAHADAVVAPLRVARGIQNKVLEGMSMARPVVATTQGAEGINCLPGKELWIADGEAAFARASIEAMTSDQRQSVMTRARARILSSYDWGQTLAGLEELMGLEDRRQAPQPQPAPRPQQANAS